MKSLRHYPKDSMDRFGDDLTELILSYLPFSAKVRLDSVSKQWRRLIYNKQFVLELNSSEEPTARPNSLNRLIGDKTSIGVHMLSDIKLPALESVLKKCPNLRAVRIRFITDGRELSVIGQYCSRLRELVCTPIGVDRQVLMDFSRKYGNRMNKMTMYNICDQLCCWKLTETVHSLLMLCVNITKIDIKNDHDNDTDKHVPMFWDISYLSIKFKEYNK